jgi:4-hydroxythreonine-4-phosphate dehydrogenase
MLMVKDDLRVFVNRSHTLNEVAAHLTEDLIIKKIETIRQS